MEARLFEQQGKSLTGEQKALYRAFVDSQLSVSPFLFTGEICPAPCEDQCTKQTKLEPVPIQSIEQVAYRIATHYGWLEDYFQLPKNNSGRSVAIVGSGPAGLEAAYRLRLVGHSVSVYERNERPGGLLSFGIPSEKGMDRMAEHYITLMKQMGINFHCGVEVGKAALAAYDLVLLAVGVTDTPRWLKLKVIKNGQDTGKMLGEVPVKNILQAMDYLSAANRENYSDAPNHYDFGTKKLLVIGGGDTATDAITTQVAHIKRHPEAARGSLTAVIRDIALHAARPLGNLYPKTPEIINGVKIGKLQSVDGEELCSYEPIAVHVDEEGALTGVEFRPLRLKESYMQDVSKPYRQSMPDESCESIIVAADVLVLALGFTGISPKIAAEFGVTSTTTAPGVMVIGDADPNPLAHIAHKPKQWIVVSAQRSAIDGARRANDILKQGGGWQKTSQDVWKEAKEVTTHPSLMYYSAKT